MAWGSFGEEASREELISWFADCKLSDPPDFSHGLLWLVDSILNKDFGKCIKFYYGETTLSYC